MKHLITLWILVLSVSLGNVANAETVPFSDDWDYISTDDYDYRTISSSKLTLDITSPHVFTSTSPQIIYSEDDDFTISVSYANYDYGDIDDTSTGNIRISSAGISILWRTQDGNVKEDAGISLLRSTTNDGINQYQAIGWNDNGEFLSTNTNTSDTDGSFSIEKSGNDVTYRITKSDGTLTPVVVNDFAISGDIIVTLIATNGAYNSTAVEFSDFAMTPLPSDYNAPAGITKPDDPLPPGSDPPGTPPAIPDEDDASCFIGTLGLTK